MTILLFLSLLLIIIDLNYVSSSSPDNVRWYRSSPIVSIDIFDICPESMGFTNAQFLNSPNENCSILFTQQCGLFIVCIDVKGDNLYTVFNMNLLITVQDMLIQSGTTNLWIADGKYIYLYDIANTPQDGSTILKAKVEKNPSQGIVINIRYFENIKGRLFFQSYGGVFIYDISNENNPQLVTTIPTKGARGVMRIYVSATLGMIFISDGSIRILKIENIEDLMKPSMPINISSNSCSYPSTFSQITELVNDRYLIAVQYAVLVAGADLNNFINSGDCNDVQFSTIYNNINSYSQATLSSDSKYMIINRVGYYQSIIEMTYTPQISAKVFQNIEMVNYLLYQSISNDSKLMMLSNQFTINFYSSKPTVNYNSISPSLLNLPQILIALKDTVVSQSPIQPFGCEVMKNNQIVYTKGKLGTYIMKENNNSHFLDMVQVINPPNFTPNLRWSTVFNNEQNLMIGRDSSIYIYNISDISNPIQLSKTDFGFLGIEIRDGYITKNSQYAVLAADVQGVMSVDISNLEAPHLLAKIYHDLPFSTSCFCLQMTSDEKYVIASYTNQGLVIYDFSDIKNPIILSYFTTMSGNANFLIRNDQFVVKSDLIYGIQIVDIRDLKQPKLYSQVKQDSSSRQCVLINDEKSLLCTSKSFGQLRHFDLSDLSNPILLQKYEYNHLYNGYSVCVNPNESVLYLGLINSIIRIGLYPSIQFETDIILTKEGGKQKNEFIDIKQIILIGMEIKVSLVQVYPQSKAYITNAKFYNNFEIQDLPFWASFSPIDQSLNIKFDQNALLSLGLNPCSNSEDSESQFSQSSNSCSKNGIDNEQTVYTFQFVFLTSQELLETDFINVQLGIDKTQSSNIFISCIQDNLVDHQYFFVGSSFEVITYLLSDKYPSPNLLQFIYYVLSQKNNYFPVILKLKQSLHVVIEDNSNNIIPNIQSINSYIYMELQVDNSSNAQFIHYGYSGDLLVYLSDKRDWIKIEGSLDSINSIISKGIKLANFTQAENISILVKIDDSANFPITKTIKASQSSFIQLNKAVQANPDLSLQDDFEKQYPDGSIYILSTFSYSFNSQIFLNPDGRPIQYEAYFFSKEGKYIPIPQNYWLLFESGARIFVGLPQSSQYRDTVKILVNATDGYTYAVQSMEIRIDLLPVSYVILLLFQIVSPIVGIFGLWKYRCYFYNLTYSNRYITTRIETMAGQEIIFQIPLLGNKLLNAQDLWKAYFKSIDKRALILEFYQNKKNTITDDYQRSKSHSSNSTSHMMGASPTLGAVNDSYTANKNLPLKRDIQLSNQNSKLKFISKFKKQFAQNFQDMSLNSSRIIQKPQNTDQQQEAIQEPKLLKYFNENGTVNSIEILNGIKEQYKQSHKYPKSKVLDQLSHPESILAKAIIGLATVQFSQISQSIGQALNYLKQVAKEEGYKQTDWYKCYAEIISQTNKIHLEQLPIIVINEKKVMETLNILFKSVNEQEKIQQFNQKLPFIKDVITAIACGFTLEKRGITPKLRGECLEIKPHKIQSIKTFRPLTNKSDCMNPSKSKEVLVSKEFLAIQELPTWVQSVDLVNNVILIKGKTEIKDIGEYVLNIYDNSHFIIKQLRILVTETNTHYLSPNIKESATNLLQINDSIISSQSNYNSHRFMKNRNSIQKTTEYNSEVPHEKESIDHKYFNKKKNILKSNSGILKLNNIRNPPSFTLDLNTENLTNNEKFEKSNNN